MQKINLKAPIVFDILKFKNLQSDWPRAFLHFTRESDFSQTCGSQTSMDLFFAISKKCYFWGVLGHCSQNEIFSQSSGPVSFLPLTHPNVTRRFKKIIWAILEKMHLYINVLTVVKPWTPFPLKEEVKKHPKCLKIYWVNLIYLVFFRFVTSSDWLLTFVT